MNGHRSKRAASGLGLVVSAVLAVGCGATGSIVPASALDVRDALTAELNAAGMSCRELEPDKLICENAATYKMILRYLSESRRILVAALFNANNTCATVASAVFDFNQRWNVAVVSCVDQDTGTVVEFLTSILVPEAGFDGSELLPFFQWWSESIRDLSQSSGLLDYLR
jgi:hypothetical protein